MSRNMLLAATALAAIASPALAQKEPQPCSRGEDVRVRCIAATRDRVILLNAQRGAALLIEVPDGERVVAIPTSDERLMRNRSASPSVRMAVPISAGESDAPPPPDETTDGTLSVKPRGTTVSLKPHIDLMPQPFFIVTEGKDGSQNRYRFQLQTVAFDQAYYSVRLQNVAAEQTERQAKWRERAAQRVELAAQDRLAQVQAAPCAALPGVNVRYVAQGDARLAPSEVCDNGRDTFLRFPGSQRIVPVWLDTPEGKPALANVVPLKDGWVQVRGRSLRLTLRDGQTSALCLINKGYTVAGQATGSDTMSPDVVRVPRGGPAS